jgi:hypothetical protein
MSLEIGPLHIMGGVEDNFPHRSFPWTKFTSAKFLGRSVGLIFEIFFQGCCDTIKEDVVQKKRA